MAPTTERSAAKTLFVFVDHPPNCQASALRSEERLLGTANRAEESTAAREASTSCSRRSPPFEWLAEQRAGPRERTTRQHGCATPTRASVIHRAKERGVP